MSRTDHARPRRAWGHRTDIRRVRTFDGRQVSQTTCSCGQVGELRDRYADAERDSYEHRRATLARLP